jgi:guanyl-specific ribonuclease Sa
MPRLLRSVRPRSGANAKLTAGGLALAVLACVAIALLIGAGILAPTATPSAATSSAGTPSAATSGATPSWAVDLGGAEQKVLAVLDVIDRTGRAPDGYRGGTQFMNDGRDGGQVLPRTGADGKAVTYREWDVNPYTGANRGTERLVTGSDGSAWYTDDHYDSFVRIR